MGTDGISLTPFWPNLHATVSQLNIIVLGTVFSANISLVVVFQHLATAESGKKQNTLTLEHTRQTSDYSGSQSTSQRAALVPLTLKHPHIV